MVKNGREQTGVAVENVLGETLSPCHGTHLNWTWGNEGVGSRSRWDGSLGGIEETSLFPSHSVWPPCHQRRTSSSVLWCSRHFNPTIGQGSYWWNKAEGCGSPLVRSLARSRGVDHSEAGTRQVRSAHPETIKQAWNSQHWEPKGRRKRRFPVNPRAEAVARSDVLPVLFFFFPKTLPLPCLTQQPPSSTRVSIPIHSHLLAPNKCRADPLCCLSRCRRKPRRQKDPLEGWWEKNCLSLPAPLWEFLTEE